MAREYSVFANIVARTQNFVDGMNDVRQEARETVTKVDQSFSSLKGTFTKVAGFIAGAFAVDKIKDFAVSIIETTADIQAVQGQYEQVMGGMKSTTDKYIDEMSVKWNKHPMELRNAMMQYMAILKGKGLSEKEAFETSKKYMDMTLDGNAFANESMSDSIGRTMGIIKGEYDSADTIMINFSQTLLNDKAIEVYGKKWDKLSVAQQENVKTTEALRQQNSAGVFGQAGREADSYANNLAMLKNNYSELLAKFGSPLLEIANKGLSRLSDIVKGINVETVMTKLGLVKSWLISMLPSVDNLKTVFQNLQPILVGVGGAIAVSFQKFTSILPEILNTATGILAKFSEWSGFLPVILGLTAAFVTYQGIVKAIALWETTYQAIQKASILLYNAQRAAVIAYGIAGGGVTGIINGMRAAMTVLNLTMLANPIVLIIAAIVGLGVALVVAYKKSETFRNIVNGVWSSLKDGFGAVINWFTTTLPQWFSNMGKWFVNFKNQVVSIFSNIWSSISSGAKTFFSFIMAALQPFISFFVKSWENLKLLVLSIVTGFFSLLTGDFEGVKLALLGIFTAFKNQFVNLWNLIKNTVVKVALSLWNGIKSGFSTGKDFVINTSKSMVTGVVNWFKSLYTKVTTSVSNVKSGISTGFSSAKTSAITTVKNLYAGVVEWFKKIPGKITEMKNNMVSTLKGINLKQIGVNVIQGFIGGIGSMIGKIKDKINDIASTVKNKLKDALDIHSPSRVTHKIGEQTGEGFANGIKKQANNVYAASKKLAEIAKKQLEKEQKSIENKKYYNELSLKHELNLYEKNMKKYKKGSEEREYYEKEIYRVKKEIHEKLVSLNDEYTNKVKDANQKLIDSEKQLNDEYQNAVNEKAKSLYSFTGLFDEINQKTDISGKKLLDNLKGQVETFINWKQNLNSLAGKGIDADLLKELTDMGPQAASEIAALNTLTGDELKQYVALWKEKHKLAKDEATKELDGMKKDTMQKIKELRNQTATELNTYKKEWLAKIKEISKGTKEEFSKSKSSMKKVGQDVIQGLIDGLGKMAPSLEKKAKSIASIISKAIKTALKIKSPSRVMMEMGSFIGQGLANGIEGTKLLVENAALGLANASNFASDFSTIGNTNSPINNLNKETTSSPQIDKPQVIDQSKTYHFHGLTVKSDNIDGFLSGLDVLIRSQ